MIWDGSWLAKKKLDIHHLVDCSHDF